MNSLSESIEALQLGGSQIHDVLVAGVDTLGQNQTVDFVPYVRTVLPIDGFVFWLNASLLSPQQRAQHGLDSAEAVTVPGSLHYASIGHMVEDETIAIRRVDFTAETQITAFAEIAPDVMYVGSWGTQYGSFRFTFSQRGSYYVQANIHHYVGDAVYPAFETQLIDDLGQFNQRQIVSNSLPLWLQMVTNPVPYASTFSPGIALYPAFFVPPNLTPPYASIEIPPASTRALQSAAWRGPDNSRFQLVTERARLSFYGLRNDEIMDWLDFSIDYTNNTGIFGIMNMPVVQDDHRRQIELATLAQKKTIEYEISYHQKKARDIAQQYIKSALVTLYPVPLAPAIAFAVGEIPINEVIIP